MTISDMSQARSFTASVFAARLLMLHSRMRRERLKLVGTDNWGEVPMKAIVSRKMAVNTACEYRELLCPL